MDGGEAQFIDVGEGAEARRIAVLARPGKGPGIVWLGGFKSEMVATKATVLADWAAAKGRAVTRFDYSGHGQSSGAFEEGTIGRWLEEAEAVVGRFCVGAQVLVGSSMGGWLALLLARRLAATDPGRIHALVLIAPAVDMTERLMLAEMTEDEKATLSRDGVVYQPTEYGDQPYAITRALIDEGKAHLLLGSCVPAPYPVRILHGTKDPDVPWTLSAELMDELEGPDATLTLVKDGDHRLSTPANLDLLRRMVASV